MLLISRRAGVWRPSCELSGSEWIPRIVDKKAITRGASIKFITPKFLLGSQPIVKREAKLAPALLKKLVSTFSDDR
jgi:hypothetical protein